MAIRRFLEETEVFTPAELLAACGDGSTNRNLLSRAVKRGSAVRIAPGLYASNTGGRRALDADPFLIVEKAAPDAVFCYETALSFFAGQQDVSRHVSFYSSVRKRGFRWSGMTYRAFPMPPAIDTTVTLYGFARTAVSTSLEQTVVDCLAHPLRAGGTEAFLRCMSNVVFLNAAKLVDLALAAGPSTSAKAGWLLERRADDWEVSAAQLERLASSLSAGPYFFAGRDAAKWGSWNARWRLYLPDQEENLERWLRE